MKAEAKFLASKEIAQRAGVNDTRFVTPEGKYILSQADLRKVKFSMTADELVNGLDVEQISDEEVKKLIRKSTLGGKKKKNNKKVKEANNEQSK